MKATFIRKYSGGKYEPHMIYMDYEYRGHEYTVYENRARGNEPLAWQHKSHQDSIDKIIEMESNPQSTSQPVDMNEIWRLLGWDE